MATKTITVLPGIVQQFEVGDGSGGGTTPETYILTKEAIEDVLGDTSGNVSVIRLGNNAMSHLGNNQSIALGDDALAAAQTQSDNVAIGYGAGSAASGGENVIIGQNAGAGPTIVSDSVIIGSKAARSARLVQNSIVIGKSAGVSGVFRNKLYIDGNGNEVPLLAGTFADDSQGQNGELVIGGQTTVDDSLQVNGALIIHSNNGTRFRIDVSNSGALSATEVG